MAYRAAVCDDSAADADYVRSIVAHWAEQRGVALECRAFSSAEQFLFCYAEDKNFDLLLLDVEMPGADGVTLAKTVLGLHRRGLRGGRAPLPDEAGPPRKALCRA